LAVGHIRTEVLSHLRDSQQDGNRVPACHAEVNVKLVNIYLAAASQLHSYLITHHEEKHALVGPDPGVRFNYRMGRFVKSYLRHVPWNDNYFYLQTQAYWALANWSLFDLTNEEAYHTYAIHCAETILARQRDDGAWDYPNPEWKGRIATVEGLWAALGLLAAYQRTRLAEYLTGALRWHEYLVKHVGFQQIGDTLAVNYFAGRADVRVPNNTTLLLYFLGRLAQSTDDRQYLGPTQGLREFLRLVQLPSGEFPYAVGNVDNPGFLRQHLQCYQYHAFECLDLIDYYESAGDDAVRPLIEKALAFLSQGVAPEGYAYYDCSRPKRRVVYHAAALGAAFTKAGQMDFVGFEELARRSFACVLAAQQENGGFGHSQGDYQLLADRRSYPRYLAMILFHLLIRAGDTAMMLMSKAKDEAHFA
jgi:hypothetical protein